MKPMIDSSRGWFTIVHLIVVPHTCNVIATNASCSDPCNDNGACNEQPHSLFNRRPVIINEPFVRHANSFHTMDFLCQAILKQLNKRTAPFKRFETWNWNTKCADVILPSGVYVVTRGETGLKQITRNKTKQKRASEIDQELSGMHNASALAPVFNSDIRNFRVISRASFWGYVIRYDTMGNDHIRRGCIKMKAAVWCKEKLFVCKWMLLSENKIWLHGISVKKY